jgi:hypothetical protein
MRRGAIDIVDEAEHVGDGDLADAPRHRAAVAPGAGQRLEHAVERSVLAEEQDLVLAAEVVVEIARRQVGGRRDVAHPGGREAVRPEDAGGGAHDRHAPGIRPFRTAVRRMNHGSILA